jgi:hypothetical protein
MDLNEFIADVESRHFRTGHDTGAHPSALFVWNLLRQHAGMERLTEDDLIMRHAVDKGWSFERMKDDYDRFETEMLRRKMREDY